MHNLIIAPSAEDDLNRIVDYIAFELGNPPAADSLLDVVDECYDTLESLPSSFPFCHDPVLRANDYHQVEVDGYIMIFRIERDANVVRVLHYYHSTQDYLEKFIGDLSRGGR